MKENSNNVLANLGFEPKEASVYLALVELGQGSVLEIARASKVNRASLYYILEIMKKKGVVTHFEERDGTHVYLPVDPRFLLAREKQRTREFESIIPELKALVNKSGHRPSVRFFEELEGVKAVYEDSLTAKT